VEAATQFPIQKVTSIIVSVAERVGEMIYRFTNVRGFQRYGLVTDLREDGLYVLLDDFRYKGDNSAIPACYAYISLEKNPFVDQDAITKTEILPPNTSVRWGNAVIEKAHKAMLSTDFGEWWKENAEDVKTQIARKLE